MDNREGIQPESMKPLPGHNPSDALREGMPPAPEIQSQPDPEEVTGFFTPTNIILLGGMLALFAYLLVKFEPIELLAILKAVLGLSFVIFIHEMGHFLAAKWCGVNVTTFSIGFGPALPGCWFTWGETTYKLAALPLGGYVQMVGQVDGDEGSDGSDDDPRSYRRKTVGQRMLIISAGVIMNALLAMVCFIAVYQGQGKEHPAPVINYVDVGAPAFIHGVPSGAEIIKIGGVDKDPTFSDLTQIVINSTGNDPIPLTFRTRDGVVVSTSIEPRKDKNDTKPFIGVGPSPKTWLMAKRSSVSGPYQAGTSAEKAGFQFGDVIIAMTDADHPDQLKDYRADRIKELPDDPRYPGKDQRDYFEFIRRSQLLAGKEIIIRVSRGSKDEAKTEVDLKVAPMYRLDLGVRMKMGPILAVRDKSPAAINDVRGPNAKSMLEGDLIEAVSVMEADGKTLLKFEDKNLDPERLPFELRQWSARLDQAKFQGERKVTLHLQRHREAAGEQFGKVTKVLLWDKDWRFDRSVPMSLNAPMPIPELGLAYQIKTTVAGKTRDDSPLQVDDVIKNIRVDIEGHEVKGKREDVKGSFIRKDLEGGQWANVSFEFFQQPASFKKLVFKIERDKQTQEVEIPLKVDETWPLTERGWHLATDKRRVIASDPMHAIWLGLVDTKSRMSEIFQNVRGMITNRIALENLGGPLTIAFATYRFAAMDFSEFMFFLGLISINLAVVNFLPIPVLDGGHMVFLLYEKLRGKPASEGVRIGATYVGLLMILCLMVFVLYLDVNRLFLQ